MILPPTVRALVAASDWASTSLGPYETWPPGLRTLAGVILSSPLAMALLWGPDAMLLYNDAFADLIGPEHPRALGRPAWEGLGMSELEAQVAEVWSGKFNRCCSLRMPLPGGRDAVHSPIPGGDGALAGILSVVREPARAEESRDAFLLRLADGLAPLDDAAGIEAAASRWFAERLGLSRAFFTQILDERDAGVSQDSLARLRRGAVVFLHDRPTAGGAASAMMIGMVQDGSLTATFVAQSARPRIWTDSEIELFRETAHRTWTAAGRAREALLSRNSLRRTMQHRFKNDLQLIASLINLQLRGVEDSRAATLLGRSRDRVFAIAAIYEALIRSQGESGVDLSEFTQRFVPELARSHAGAQNVTIRLEVEPLVLDPERAMPVGVILNELLTNVRAHAFPDGSRGEVEVRGERDGDVYVLTVADNGVGLPPHVDVHAPTSLGLQLVRMLAHQLEGRIEVLPSSGALIQLRIPAGEIDPEVVR